jgi:hypothetical protein
MGRPGIQRITRYSDDFKVTAVRLSDLPEVLIQDVAAALAGSHLQQFHPLQENHTWLSLYISRPVGWTNPSMTK